MAQIASCLHTPGGASKVLVELREDDIVRLPHTTREGKDAERLPASHSCNKVSHTIKGAQSKLLHDMLNHSSMAKGLLPPTNKFVLMGCTVMRALKPTLGAKDCRVPHTFARKISHIRLHLICAPHRARCRVTWSSWLKTMVRMMRILQLSTRTRMTP